jgi:hypothetical protein
VAAAAEEVEVEVEVVGEGEAEVEAAEDRAAEEAEEAAAGAIRQW